MLIGPSLDHVLSELRTNGIEPSGPIHDGYSGFSLRRAAWPAGNAARLS
jgi:hypothetical protein